MATSSKRQPLTQRLRAAGPRDPSRAARAGFTLVETMFALLILVVLILGLFSTLAYSRSAEVFAREHQTASQAAFAKLDELMATPTGSIPQEINAASEAFHASYSVHSADTGGVTAESNLFPADPSYFAYNTDAESTATPLRGKAGHVSVIPSDLNGDGTDDMIDIRITVAWTSRLDGANQRIDVVTQRYLPQ